MEEGLSTGKVYAPDRENIPEDRGISQGLCLFRRQKVEKVPHKERVLRRGGKDVDRRGDFRYNMKY